MDVARWGLGAERPLLRLSMWSVGGRFGYTDDGETANTQLAFMNYGDQTLLFEVRGLVTDNYAARQGTAGVTVGNVFPLAPTATSPSRTTRPRSPTTRTAA